MRYLPHTEQDISAMLEDVGAPSIEALFSTVPENCRREKPMVLPEQLTEWELAEKMEKLSSAQAVSPRHQVYLGAGSYEHFIPASAAYLLSRGEFVTSYTPYQPEMSQGTLQAIYEYQTLTARLLGMEVANASVYDGASALAEALLMAIRVTGKKKVAVSRLIHPHYRQVVNTYFNPTDFKIETIGYGQDGRTDMEAMKKAAQDEKLAAIALQTPNFLGAVEPLLPVADLVHDKGALLVSCCSEPLAYGIFQSPGDQGADIACAEGQSLGIPASFGGPALGMFASRMKFVRNMPGRLVGKTRDIEGKRGFVLTLATREQHIRREKATSNICTNHSLCALASVMFMASLGGTGFRRLAKLNHDKAEYLKGALKNSGLKIPFSSPTFNEFVVRFEKDFRARRESLLEKNIVAGLDLSPYYPELENHYLFCVTETKSKEQLDRLVKEVTS